MAQVTYLCGYFKHILNSELFTRFQTGYFGFAWLSPEVARSRQLLSLARLSRRYWVHTPSNKTDNLIISYVVAFKRS